VAVSTETTRAETKEIGYQVSYLIIPTDGNYSKNIFLFHELSLPYSLIFQHHYNKELFVTLFHSKRNFIGYSYEEC